MLDALKKLFAPDSASSETIGVVVPVDIFRGDGTTEYGVLAQVDTTSEFSCIDKTLARDLQLYSPDQILQRQDAQELGFPSKGMVDVIAITFFIQGKLQRSQWCVVNRSEEKHAVILGKNDLTGFTIRV